MRATSTETDAPDDEAGEASTTSTETGVPGLAEDGSTVVASAPGAAAVGPDEPGEEPQPDGGLGDEPSQVSPAGDEMAEDAEPPEPDPPAFLDELETQSPDADFEEDPLLAPPEMSQMLFVDVVLLLPATHPVVVLQEADAPFRELRIPIGGAEGVAIGYAARGIATPRPLTHELFSRLLEEYGMSIDVVRITDVNGSAFSAEIVVSGPQGVREIDCRPSDAIALALRQRLPVPIVASPIVLAIAGTDPLGAN